MQYLIQPIDSEPFFTKWFEPENNFMPGMIVYDMHNLTYSTDGKVWKEIEIDHL